MEYKDIIEEIVGVRRNEENLHLPFITLKTLGEVNLPTQVLRRLLSGEMENWVGQSLNIQKRIARKNIKYFIDLRKFNFSDYKEWEI